MKRHAMETTMERLARIYANKRDIVAVPGNCFATNGQKIYYVPIPDNADPYILMKSKHGFFHEKDHCVFTDFTDLQAGKIKGSYHSVLNVLEDIRIERLGAREWKGQINLVRESLKEICHREINSRFVDPSVSMFKKILDLLYIRAKENELGDMGLIVPDKIQRLLEEKTGDLMPAILKADTQEEMEKIAQTLHERMKDINPPPPPPQKQKAKQSGKNDEDESSESDTNQEETSDDEEGNEGDGENQQEEGDVQSDEHSSGDESEDQESGEDESDEDGSGTGSESDDSDSDEGSEDGEEDDSAPEDQDESDSEDRGDDSESGDQSGSSDEDGDGEDSESPGGIDEDDTDQSDGTPGDHEGSESGGREHEEEKRTCDENNDNAESEGSDEDDTGSETGSDKGSDPIEQEREELAEQVNNDEEESSINEDIEKDVESHAEELGIYREANDLKEDIRRYDGHEGSVRAYEEQGRKMLAGNTSKFKRLFISMRAPKMTKMQKAGRLDLQRVWNDDSDIIFQKRQPGMMENSAVSMVIDNSSSMDGAKAMVASSLLAYMARELDRLRIPFECMGFTVHGYLDMREGVRHSPILINLIKEFNEPYRKVRKHFDWPREWTRGTIEFPCIKYAAQRLVQRDETKKVLFILSDGESGCPAEMMTAMIEYIKNLIKAGVIVVGIGILDGCIANYVPDTIVIRDINRIAPEIFNKLTRILLKEGR